MAAYFPVYDLIHLWADCIKTASSWSCNASIESNSDQWIFAKRGEIIDTSK